MGTFCKRGLHIMTGDNVIRERIGGRDVRRCRACRNSNQRDRHARLNIKDALARPCPDANTIPMADLVAYQKEVIQNRDRVLQQLDAANKAASRATAQLNRAISRRTREETDYQRLLQEAQKVQEIFSRRLQEVASRPRQEGDI